jgi:hypothetical protein
MLGAEYLEFEAVRRGVRGLRFEPLSCGGQACLRQAGSQDELLLSRGSNSAQAA